MLEIQNVSKTFNAGTVNEKTALNGLNLKLNEGDFVTVIGGNGAGKSTMLNAVAGVWPVDSGKIIIDGTDVTSPGMPFLQLHITILLPYSFHIHRKHRVPHILHSRFFAAAPIKMLLINTCPK